MHRRQFIQWGAASVVGAAALGACTSNDDRTPPAPQPPTTASPTASSGTGPTDLTLARTTASLEAMLIAAYAKMADTHLVTNPMVLALATAFVQHHTQHLTALNGIITATNGQTPISAPNQVMNTQIVQPALDAAKTPDDLLHLFFTLEDAIAQTYVYAAGAATRPDIRASMMSIGGIEARHRIILGMQVEQLRLDDLFPDSFARKENPLPPDALVT